MNQPRGKLVSGFLGVVIFVAITGIVLVFVEGLSSAALAFFEALRSPPRVATQYDESLGWVGIPNANLPNEFGTGKYVRTNSRGFRNEREFSEAVPEGKLRVICSGDSFTYGQGVANNRTWCHRLSELEPRFETVNLGHPGYGVDQSYLRYLRDGLSLDHSIHVFAFIHGDLDRMAREQKNSYGKPMLALEGGALVPKNVPVPHLRWSAYRAFRRADLRTLELADRILGRFRSHPPQLAAMVDSVGPVAAEVFRSLQEISNENGVVPLFVYLPTESDLEKQSAWRGWLASTMDDLGAAFFDLTPDLQTVPAGQAASYFILRPSPAAGHYTEAGNDWAAALLFERIVELAPARELRGG
jgi:hypothetical protein